MDVIVYLSISGFVFGMIFFVCGKKIACCIDESSIEEKSSDEPGCEANVVNFHAFKSQTKERNFARQFLTVEESKELSQVQYLIEKNNLLNEARKIVGN